MTEEMLTIIRDMEEHRKHLIDKLYDNRIEYSMIIDKLKNNEFVIKKLLEEATPSLAKY